MAARLDRLAWILLGLSLLCPAGATGSQLHVTWTDNADNETAVSVERRGETDTKFTEVAVLAANTTSYVDAGLVASATYCYRVRALNSAGPSAYSNVACATAPAAEILAALLPSSRSAQPGGVATVFATILNPAPIAATACGVALVSDIPAVLSYQAIDLPAGRPSATAGAPVDIPAGEAQSYLIALAPTARITPTEVALEFRCTNTRSAPMMPGVNTLQFSAPASPIADIVAVAATLGGDGIVDVPRSTGIALFAVGSSNVGVTSGVTVGAHTGLVHLPLLLTVCETDSRIGSCLSPPAPTVTLTYEGSTARSFAVFAQATGTIAFNPAMNRVFVRFQDMDGTLLGATSVAVRTGQ